MLQSDVLPLPDALAHAVDRLEIALPPLEPMDQDEEWVVVKTDAGWQKIRLHDYHEVFRVPGLYEKWVYQTLRCQSPQKMADLLARMLLREGVSAEELKVLDVGAGNGCVAGELRSIGIRRFVGLDLIEEAADAAERDRPGLYDDYAVCDLTRLTPDMRARLQAHGFNALTCVAALGFGDIPPAAFAPALNLIENDGLVAFNIKSDFVDAPDASPFARLVTRMLDAGVIESKVEETYIHRLNPAGEALEYVAIVGRKRRDIPQDWIEPLED